ncbi:hypothetical protein [Streptomyces brasiliensis]|uniref:Uncharacterized protein n=1 Tax=Streptomyces brasiliensis TaxID=1954 RepID=A0A917KP21_9ACTN|nr:hypothetical protein [Streptomyces brasiliensis]GGJ20711.1 hypothetical protein GCM10010121_034610 [Streptomyces brasiliensis]
MTMHAVVLPGYQQHSTTCRDGDCPADFGIVSQRVLLLREWKRALQSGPTAIDAYLAEHNAKFRGRHRAGCPLADLPPAVHASCEGYDDQGRNAFEQLRYAMQQLADARARGDRPVA